MHHALETSTLKVGRRVWYKQTLLQPSGGSSIFIGGGAKSQQKDGLIMSGVMKQKFNILLSYTVSQKNCKFVFVRTVSNVHQF